MGDRVELETSPGDLLDREDLLPAALGSSSLRDDVEADEAVRELLEGRGERSDHVRSELRLDLLGDLEGEAPLGRLLGVAAELLRRKECHPRRADREPGL